MTFFMFARVDGVDLHRGYEVGTPRRLAALRQRGVSAIGPVLSPLFPDVTLVVHFNYDALYIVCLVHDA